MGLVSEGKNEAALKNPGTTKPTASRYHLQRPTETEPAGKKNLNNWKKIDNTTKFQSQLADFKQLGRAQKFIN